MGEHPASGAFVADPKDCQPSFGTLGCGCIGIRVGNGWAKPDRRALDQSPRWRVSRPGGRWGSSWVVSVARLLL